MSKVTLVCSRPGDFGQPFHPDPVSIARHGPGPDYAPVHCVPRKDEKGDLCMLAMNAFAVPESFEVFVDRTVLLNNHD